MGGDGMVGLWDEKGWVCARSKKDFFDGFFCSFFFFTLIPPSLLFLIHFPSTAHTYSRPPLRLHKLQHNLLLNKGNHQVIEHNTDIQLYQLACVWETACLFSRTDQFWCISKVKIMPFNTIVSIVDFRNECWRDIRGH